MLVSKWTYSSPTVQPFTYTHFQNICISSCSYGLSFTFGDSNLQLVGDTRNALPTTCLCLTSCSSVRALVPAYWAGFDSLLKKTEDNDQTIIIKSTCGLDTDHWIVLVQTISNRVSSYIFPNFFFMLKKCLLKKWPDYLTQGLQTLKLIMNYWFEW